MSFAEGENERVANGILLAKLFWSTVRKKCFSDWEKILKFEAEGREFAKILRSLEKFCWNNTFLNFLMEVLFRSNTLEQTIGM